MNDALFRSLPEPVQKLLRSQIKTTISMHEATGLPMVECRKMVLASGGRQELLALVGLLHLKGEM